MLFAWNHLIPTIICCIKSKHNVPVSITDISKHIIECFVCGVCSMPTQEMRVQPPLTLTGLYYKLQNNSSQSTTTSSEMWSPVPVTKSISHIQKTPPLSPTATYIPSSNWQPPYCLPDIFFFIFYPPSYHHHHYHSLSLFHVYPMLVSAFSNRWGVSRRWRRWSVLGAPK